MMRKATYLLLIFLFTVNVNVKAFEYENNYIDLEIPNEFIEQYENYTKNNKYDDLYLNTNNDGEVTTASVSDPYYSSVDLGYITPVKNQMSTGSCWAHAGLSVLETTAIKNGIATTSLDLSEMHLVYGTHSSAFSDKEMMDRFYLGGPLNSTNNGGNIIMTASYLFSGLGAIKNDLFPLKSYSSYSSGEIIPVLSNGREKQITSSEYNSINSKPEYYVNSLVRAYGTKGSCKNSVNSIKNMILKFGSVQISIDSQTANYHNGYYFVNTSTTKTNHAVTLVGWDDTIEASKFDFTDETKTGAWIMKNSWGTSKGNKGYYYVSYYDNTVCGSASSFDGVDTNNYNHVYDSSGMYLSSSIYNLSDKSVYQASVFNNEGSEEHLKKVAFAVNPGYSYEVYYSPFNDGNWKNQMSSWTKIGTLGSSNVNYDGIKSIFIDNDIVINSKYVIIVKGTRPNSASFNYPVVTYKEKTFKDNTISTIKMNLVEGENYFSTTGTIWTDLYNYSYSYDYICGQTSDGKNKFCTYNSADTYEGAQNNIYAYTIEDKVEPLVSTIVATFINSNNQTVSNFYSFDDSSFSIDIRSVDRSITNFYPVITNSKNVDYTSYFNVSLDSERNRFLVQKVSNKYIPFDTYHLIIYFDDNNSGNFNNQILSSLVVTKPFYIKGLSVTTPDNKIYENTSFGIELKDYASTLDNSKLSYLIKLNQNDVTNKFMINYYNGVINVSPKESVDIGNYTFYVSINNNDKESINFEVNKSYTMSYSTENDELLLSVDNDENSNTIEALQKNVSSIYGYQILNSNDDVISPSLIGTGMKLKLNTSPGDYKIYTFIIVGDLSGDGKISTSDYVRLWNHLDRSVSYTISDEIVLKAADISGDSRLSTSDYVKLWNRLKRG